MDRSINEGIFIVLQVMTQLFQVEEKYVLEEVTVMIQSLLDLLETLRYHHQAYPGVTTIEPWE